MHIPTLKISLWSPRILGIGVSLYIAMFALDAMSDGSSEFLLHLAPAAGLLLIVGFSWNRQWLGAAVFSALALYYAIAMSHRLDWVALISGPLLAAGLLYWWGWRRRPS